MCTSVCVHAPCVQVHVHVHACLCAQCVCQRVHACAARVSACSRGADVACVLCAHKCVPVRLGIWRKDNLTPRRSGGVFLSPRCLAPWLSQVRDSCEASCGAVATIRLLYQLLPGTGRCPRCPWGEGTAGTERATVRPALQEATGRSLRGPCLLLRPLGDWWRGA